MDAVVARLHHCLVQALRVRGAEAFRQPVTVAEIYQDLAPYRNVRASIGVELNADYEHALLRLLAGEDGRVRLEPVTARETLEDELRSPDPYVGLYRKFAACDVWIAPGDEAALPPLLEPPSTLPAPRPAPPVEPEPAGTAAQASAGPARRGAAGGEGAPANACVFCEGPLPAERIVRFCPHCGADQRQKPCPRCGEALDTVWRFCIGCGSAAGEAPER